MVVRNERSPPNHCSRVEKKARGARAASQAESSQFFSSLVQGAKPSQIFKIVGATIQAELGFLDRWCSEPNRACAKLINLENNDGY